MIVQWLVRRLLATGARLILLAILVGIGWVVLQFYSVEALEAHARRFWTWWSGLVHGRYVQYWDPVGAAAALFFAVSFLLKPFMPRQRGYSSSGNNWGNDGGDDGADGGE